MIKTLPLKRLKPSPKKLRGPLKWHGGKQYDCRRIVAMMPPHKVYNEPYFGGGAVLLNKPRAETEFASDLDPELALFWEVVAREDRFWQMRERLYFNKYSKETFALAKSWVEHREIPLDQIAKADFAAFYLMRNRMSRGGMCKDFAWSDRLRGGQPGEVNAYETMLTEIIAVHMRMKTVRVRGLHAPEAIRETDSIDTLHYLDPPYPKETRTHKTAYGPFEMSDEQHDQLLSVAVGCSGWVMISGYDNDLYNARLKGWSKARWTRANHSGQGKVKQKRTEILWANFDVASAAA